jgi:hypothetical protein
MTLIDELKERRDRKEEVLDEVAEAIKEREEYRLRVEQELDDLDLAIAALQPGEVLITVSNDEPDHAAPIINTDEGWELEPEMQAGVDIPEGFTKWEGGECPVDPAALVCVVTRSGKLEQFHAGTFANPYVLFDQWQWSNYRRDDDIIAYRVSLAAPTPEDEPDVASEFAEELERAAAIELTADVPPEPEFIELDQETCEPIQPQWNEPQTEGYAPVVDQPPTNPEADALAKAHDWYDPKAVHDRQKFNPWGIFKRETEDA